MSAADQSQPERKRSHVTGDFSRAELGLANRNSGILLEALRHDISPVGIHFLLSHFDVPFVDAAEDWRLDVGGLVRRPLSLKLADLQALAHKTLRVTLECAGNGRATHQRRWQSMPWEYSAVGTADWTGTPLRHVLEQAGVEPGAVDIAFIGADRGIDNGDEHDYGRSLPPAMAMSEDVLLVWGMNGAPLAPQHGFPLRLVVPGWYGMASVKWLRRIEALERRFDGYQQARNYHYRQHAGDPGTPVTAMRVKSLLSPPGIPDWYTRERIVERGPVEITGRAWSGNGVGIARVELGVDGMWQDAALDQPLERYAWRGWRCMWNAEPGVRELCCRATDAAGNTQPLDPPWDNVGFGNNGVHRVAVTVR